MTTISATSTSTSGGITTSDFDIVVAALLDDERCKTSMQSNVGEALNVGYRGRSQQWQNPNLYAKQPNSNTSC